MAKKSLKKKPAVSGKAKKAAVKETPAVVAAAAKPEGKKNMMVIIFVIALVLISAEIFVIAMKQKQQNKKPALVTAWNVQYASQVGMPVSGNSLYVIDNRMNQVKKYDKMTGTLSKTYSFQNEPRWAQEDSKGDTFVFLKELNKIVKMDAKGKFTPHITDVYTSIANFVIDLQDNLYISDSATGKIVKYSPEGQKIVEFGGKGSDKGKFENLWRISADKSGKIYAIDASAPIMINVFSEEGKFIKEFKLPLKQINNMEVLVITADGNIYVNDWNDSTIKVFDNNGKPLGKWDSDASLRYKIGMPGAFSGGLDNFLYVGSYNVGIFEPIKY